MLRARGVPALYLFGSYARDEAAGDSDVDLFVAPADSNAFGLIPLFDSQAIAFSSYCRKRTGGGAMRIVPRYRPYIERDAIRIF